jgi:hypothetical protein
MQQESPKEIYKSVVHPVTGLHLSLEYQFFYSVIGSSQRLSMEIFHNMSFGIRVEI